MLEDKNKKSLINLNLKEFTDETASESPAPGGGSIAAYCGAMGASLSTMVANLSANKRGWDDQWQTFSNWAEKGTIYQNQLLDLVDEDTKAFNEIMNSFRLPNDTELEKKIRLQHIQAATKHAIKTPFRVMEIALESMQVMKEMALSGNPNSITDAAVGALCARTAIRGAYLNVQINCKDYDDNIFIDKILKDCQVILKQAKFNENEILDIANTKISK